MIDAVLVGVGLISQQVLQIDGQAITGRHPQHNRPWTLVRAQRDLARHCCATLVEGDLVFINHIAAQREDHAVGILGTEAVEHQWLVERHYVGHQIALAAHGSFADCLPTQGGGSDQQ